MNFKTFIARWIAHRLEIRTRMLRRQLRDYQRQELACIHQQEKRSRGLRLYAAWSRRKTGTGVTQPNESWHMPVPHAA